MENFFEEKSVFLKALEESLNRFEAIKKLPEYQHYLDVKNSLDEFKEYIKQKRVDRIYSIIEKIAFRKFGNDEEKRVIELEKWINRLVSQKNKLKDSYYKKGYSFCESNVMDLIWEVFLKYGEKLNHSIFGDNAYVIGEYIMSAYDGQGEYTYLISVAKRIY